MAKITVTAYQVGAVNHAKMNKTVKIADTMFAWHMQWISSTIQMKTDLRIICLARESRLRRYIYTWSPFIIQLKLYLLYTAQVQFVLYSVQVYCSLSWLVPQCCQHLSSSASIRQIVDMSTFNEIYESQSLTGTFDQYDALHLSITPFLLQYVATNVKQMGNCIILCRFTGWLATLQLSFRASMVLMNTQSIDTL